VGGWMEREGEGEREDINYFKITIQSG